MRTLTIFRNGTFAGLLIEENRKHYIFKYDDKYFMNDNCADISLTLPKSKKEYHSEYLFPFFFNMLSEGINRQLQCKQLKIDEEDDFGLLATTAQCDTIGAITVKPIL
jgi:HipA-like protein